MAVILRNSLHINGMLANAEAWYDIKKNELETLENGDESLLRQMLKAPSSLSLYTLPKQKMVDTSKMSGR